MKTPNCLEEIENLNILQAFCSMIVGELTSKKYLNCN